MTTDWNKTKWFASSAVPAEPVVKKVRTRGVEGNNVTLNGGAEPAVAGFFEDALNAAEDTGNAGLKLAQEGATFVKGGGVINAAVKHTQRMDKSLQPEPAETDGQDGASLADLAIGPLAWGSRFVENIADKAGASELSDTARAVRIGSYLAGAAVVLGAVGYTINAIRR